MSTTTVTPLTTADAETLVTAARTAAEAAGVAVSVTVLDAGGHLLAFRRDDRAVLISGETSTRKAYTALQLNAPTADLVDLVKPDGPFHSLPTALDRPLLFIAGGVPVHRDGKLIGALGIGGGAPEQDHGFATAALRELVELTGAPVPGAGVGAVRRMPLVPPAPLLSPAPDTPLSALCKAAHFAKSSATLQSVP